MRDFGFFNLKFITEVDQTNLQNSLESLQELQHEHEKSMQEAFNNTPEKPKPKPKQQYQTKRTSYGNRKLD